MNEHAGLPDYDEPLAFDEFERRRALASVELDGPVGDDMQSFIAWFRRRYPSPTERVRYAARMSRSAREIQGALLPHLRARPPSGQR
jgi:hypothetical protein